MLSKSLVEGIYDSNIAIDLNIFIRLILTINEGARGNPNAWGLDLNIPDEIGKHDDLALIS
jgi:hypothetical protein